MQKRKIFQESLKFESSKMLKLDHVKGLPRLPQKAGPLQADAAFHCLVVLQVFSGMDKGMKRFIFQ